MPLPEVIVRRGDRGAAPLAFDDVSARFEAVVTQRGPVGVPIECRSFGQVRQQVGDHTTYSTLRAVESYFAEGGTRAILSRVVGPDHRNARLELSNDGSEPEPVLLLEATGPGSWYHGISVRVGAGTDPVRTITVMLDGAVLASGNCSTAAEAIDLINGAGYVTATSGSAAWPPKSSATAMPLAGGDDDLGDIDDARVSEALNAFDEDLGAGSVCASGWGCFPVHSALADHAAANNRLARADMDEIVEPATLKSHAARVRALPNAAYIQLLAGWPTIQVGGVTLSVPPSGVHTGREARTDRENGPGPGQPCAWRFGEYRTPFGVAQSWSRQEREDLNDAGITVIVQDPQGAIYAEDAITAIDGARYPQYGEVAPMRVAMAIHAQAKAVLRQRVMQTLDGRGHLAAVATGDLVAICSDWYARNALYGDAPGEAFAVNVEAQTPPGGKARLVGYLALRPSPATHTIELTITQVAAGDTI